MCFTVTSRPAVRIEVSGGYSNFTDYFIPERRNLLFFRIDYCENGGFFIKSPTSTPLVIEHTPAWARTTTTG